MTWLRNNWPAPALTIIYLVGLTGFLLPATRDEFAPMSWASLLLSFILLLYSERNKSAKWLLSLLAVGSAGFLLEVAGVKTGLLFGEYTYGGSLGIKLLETPLMIGVNWILLVYLSSCIARRFSGNALFISAAAAAMMTGLDVLIEPFAIRFDLWSWAVGHVPLQNYLMWFLISFVMNYFFLKLNSDLRNPLAVPLAVILLVFFLIVDIAVIW